MPWSSLFQPIERLTAEAGLEDWYARLLARLGGTPQPFELALAGGLQAATPGLAFLAGYQAALRMLWPAAPWTAGALCVTENRSTRPADMSTRIYGLYISGRKDFVTAADCADWLLVAAREDSTDEPPRLALGVVRQGAPGVRIEPLPALPLMPDIGHARLHLEQAQSERLAGDGWDDYVKPFRTLEDVHVLAAVVAWQFGVGRECAWPDALLLRLQGLLAGCAEVARQAPNAATTHLLLAGLFAEQQALAGELHAAFSAGPAHWAELWQRDQGLLRIAEAARSKRLEKARRIVAGC
ncbi:acyl-CoA dehydrogenase family protein [Pseudomonas wenzhouensis]|uniref:acyl-CoA dehydrogenase family protein n=1 Tax=Pseudomonas wenzhouensis TaxID=2906062 RepID=UPI001E5A5AE2|nr:acyl-CoA dehydrogenase family protein [Pseudomonas wenzhouensis]UFQ98594.1 acyl-CoA dehydrogenase [Pseudomonas wenzhouensis]